MKITNIYCDESCHLQSDKSDIMVLGAVWCPKGEVKDISDRIKQIKEKHGLSSHIELKWKKVSSKKIQMFEEIIDFFFDSNHLQFRGLVAKGKTKLDHSKFNQSHDDWYYKMYFYLLGNILTSEKQYNIMLDRKDSIGFVKVEKLHKVLSNSIYDFDRSIIKSMNTITSELSTCLQLADLLSGALGYINRSLQSNKPKLKVIEKIKQRSRKSLTLSTLPNEQKFNIFIWEPRS